MAAIWKMNSYLKRNYKFPKHFPVSPSSNPHLCPTFPPWVMRVQYSEGVLYGREYSVREYSILRDMISTAQVSYVRWKISSVLWKVFSTMKRYHQYERGISSVLWRNIVRN